MSLKVLVVTEARFERRDGAIHCPTGGRAYDFWARYLDVFDSVSVLARVGASQSELHSPVEGEGVHVISLRGYQGPSGFVRSIVPVMKTIRGGLRESHAVIVRLPGIIGTLTARMLAREGRKYGVECVGDPHEVFRRENIQNPMTVLLRPLFVRDLEWHCSNSSAVAYVTKGTLQRIYPAGPNTRTTHYSSVELAEEAFVTTPRGPAESRVPLRLVTVARLEQPYKGTDVLLRAVQRCVQRDVDLRLTIVGDGRHRETMEKLSRHLAISDRVEFAGNVASGAGVRAFLDAADLFVMPSRTEGLPRALIEGMARALPAVGSNVGGIPELLSSDALVPAGDDRALADRIGALSRQPDVLAQHSVRNLRAAREYAGDVLAARRRAFYGWVRDATQAHDSV